MSAKSRSLVCLSLAVVPLALFGAAPARAQSSAYSPDSLRKRRAALFVMAGQQPLKQMAGNVFLFATDSEHCRVTYGSKACGLPSDSLKGGELEQVFDYYVKQPTDWAVGQQQPSVHKQDWDWNPNSRQSGKVGDNRDKQ